VETKSRVVKL